MSCGNAVKFKVSSRPLMPASGRRSPVMWLVALLHRMPNHKQIELVGDQEDKFLVLLLSKVDFQWRRATAACSLLVEWAAEMRKNMRMPMIFLGSSIVVPVVVLGNKSHLMQFIVARDS